MSMQPGLRGPETTAHLDDMLRLVSGEAPPPPIAAHLGLRAMHAELGRSVIEMEADGRLANPMGTLHGGVLCDLSDLAMGMAMATTLEDDESFTTLDLNAKYLKPVWKTRLRATATVVKRTRTLGLIECDVTDESGSLVARVLSTCMVLRGAEARGR
jgi:uncharacterized protein (TIGR00369 family)